MDPNANLVAQLRLAEEIIRFVATAPEVLEGAEETQRLQEIEHRAYELAELVQALDTWIRSSGFLPYPWTAKT
jgi:hypothetical protein